MNCISCGSTSFSVYINTSYFELPVYLCQNCNLGVTGDSEYVIKNKLHVYGGEYWDERNAELSIDSGYSDIDSQGKRRNWVSQYLYCEPYLRSKKSILEIGAGAGQATYWFDQHGFSVTAIEPDPRNVSKINSKLKNSRCISGFVEDLHIEEKFDIIWMSHVLEHLVRPDLFLQKIRNNLKTNGIFFIEVPNCDNRELLSSTAKTQPHIFHFSQKSLQNIASKAGFRINHCDIFRPATPLEGGINKILKKLHLGLDPFPYYPRIVSDRKSGRDLRIILAL